MALGTQLTPEQRGYMETVRESAQSLLDVVNDLLDFSMLEAGKLVLEPGAMGLGDCLDRAIAPFSLPAAAAGVEIVRTVASDVPNELVGDGRRLRQVLGYLLGNALQSTSRGHIEVKVDVEGRPAREATLHVVVQDTGRGLPEKELATIFQPAFQQPGRRGDPEGSGSGLGLAIASRLVGLMGGSIRAASQVGQGSEFHFTVRLGVREKAAARSAGAAISDLQDVAVLIIDHDTASRNILEKTLYRWRMQPTSVESSDAALDQLRRARQAGKQFGLVILDAWMPDMNSFDLAEQIRNESRQGNTAIVMLSGQQKAEHLDLAKSLGIGAYLSKPVRQTELLEALGRALSRPAGGAEAASDAAAGGQPALFVSPRRATPTPQPAEPDAPAAATTPPAPAPAVEATPPTPPAPAARPVPVPVPAPRPSPVASRPAVKATGATNAQAADATTVRPPAAAPVEPPPMAPEPEFVEDVPPVSQWVEPAPVAAPAPKPAPVAASIPAPIPAPVPVAAAPVVASPAASSIPPADQSLRVLVADHDPDNKVLVGRMLEKAGHLVASVSDGMEVLDAMASEEYDLILLAVEMPRLGGMDTAADIRRTESGADRHVPIVAMTGRFSKEEEALCRQAGMDAYLCQPIDSDSLLAAIDAATHRGAPVRPQPAAGSR
jgi:CheY-like chemotaxis protein